MFFFWIRYSEAMTSFHANVNVHGNGGTLPHRSHHQGQSVNNSSMGFVHQQGSNSGHSARDQVKIKSTDFL